MNGEGWRTVPRKGKTNQKNKTRGKPSKKKDQGFRYQKQARHRTEENPVTRISEQLAKLRSVIQIPTVSSYLALFLKLLSITPGRS